MEAVYINNESLGEIEKKREEKKWKRSLNCYMMHPNGFVFGVEDYKPKKLKKF